MDHGNASFKFELHEPVIINDPDNEFHGRVGHVRKAENHGHPAYIVEFEGTNVMPMYAEEELRKLIIADETRPEMLKDEDYSPQDQARRLVQKLFYTDRDAQLDIAEIYVVWYVTALQNWKALVSTNVADDCYYEVTHNGDKVETYVDRYVKEVNVEVLYHEDGTAHYEFNNIVR